LPEGKTPGKKKKRLPAPATRNPPGPGGVSQKRDARLKERKLGDPTNALRERHQVPAQAPVHALWKGHQEQGAFREKAIGEKNPQQVAR